MRSSLHLADYRSEKHEPNCSIPDTQPGNLHLCPSRMDHPQLSTKEILGCVIMFAAIILAQLPQKQTE